MFEKDEEIHSFFSEKDKELNDILGYETLFVSQRYDGDCGVACAAMALKKDYDEIFEEIPRKNGMSFQSLKRFLEKKNALKSFSFFQKEKRIELKEIYPNLRNCIVLISGNGQTEYMSKWTRGHYIFVSRDGFIYDPDEDVFENFDDYIKPLNKVIGFLEIN